MDLTHIDSKGNAVMVNISEKQQTEREAIAAGVIRMNEDCYEAIQNRTAKKGDVLGVAQIAGIMAVKRTSELIPLCHAINITHCKVEFSLHPKLYEVSVLCTVGCTGKTGVEMEALTGASVALLTIYDMCKAIDKRMEIANIHLVEKTGGKSGKFTYEQGEEY